MMHVRWCMPTTPALRRKRQGSLESDWLFGVQLAGLAQLNKVENDWEKHRDVHTQIPTRMQTHIHVLCTRGGNKPVGSACVCNPCIGEAEPDRLGVAWPT